MNRLMQATSGVLCSIVCAHLLLAVTLYSQPGRAAKIQSGAEQASLYLPGLKSKRVGILVNQTSTIGSQHLVDSLIARNIHIALIFSPEHGFRGTGEAGEELANNIDQDTGIEIISLYGESKRPLAKDLKKISQLVFDIQDVGVRYYTYISTMHYLMQACADYNIPLLVLDRPNPNGDYIDGPVLDLQYQSFVGMHPIPVVHGLTVGELALMINGEGWLDNDGYCDLKVIAALNYDHNMRYSLPVKPSPNLPNDLAVALYPSLGFFEATPVSVGRGTPWPFQVLGYPDSQMGNFQFKPTPISGSWSSGIHAGATLWGNRVVSNEKREIQLEHVLEWQQMFDREKTEFVTRPDYLDKLAGGKNFREQLASGASAKQIRASWKAGLKKYQSMRENYLLYPDSWQITTNHSKLSVD